MISCAAAYDQSIYGAMKLPSTRSLTMLNGNEMDMGTLFHPTAEGFCGPRGVFAELAGRGSQWAAGGIWSMLMREREFQVCLQFTLSFPPRSDCFVCLFVLHPGGWEKKMMEKWIIGFGGIFLYGHPFISATSYGHAGDAAGNLVLKTVCLPCNELITLIFLTFMIC